MRDNTQPMGRIGSGGGCPKQRSNQRIRTRSRTCRGTVSAGGPVSLNKSRASSPGGVAEIEDGIQAKGADRGGAAGAGVEGASASRERSTQHSPASAWVAASSSQQDAEVRAQGQSRPVGPQSFSAAHAAPQKCRCAGVNASASASVSTSVRASALPSNPWNLNLMTFHTIHQIHTCVACPPGSDLENTLWRFEACPPGACRASRRLGVTVAGGRRRSRRGSGPR